ncbi:ATP-binding protein [uncultured Mobiluncus sp.]|uniref:ATP-binding protein n=1 Tax=uncultured Mobiluncus sp. TaxID=293425 RepID=UPI00261D9D5F|nr:AAA family ATPase [uncultured Mobiluncus sp.]
MQYLERALDGVLPGMLAHLPAICIQGPRAVGKTSTALRYAKTSWLLDAPGQQSLLEAQPSRLLADTRPVLIDEWQRLPEVFDLVRREVDREYAPGSFLLTGSALIKDSSGTHTGAGRVTTLRMHPMSLFERGVHEVQVNLGKLLMNPQEKVSGATTWQWGDYAEAICASGFPRITTLPAPYRSKQLRAYLQAIVDRDAPEAGYNLRSPGRLQAWMRAYAAASSTTTGYGEILKAATPGEADKPAKNTALAYRDFLTRIWILDPVPAWDLTANPITRLAKSPKHQLADPALAASLLDLDAEALRDDPVMGPRLFEALAVLTLRVAGQVHGLRAYHLRTQNGDHEIDLLLRGAGKRTLAFEVKLKTDITSDDCRHLLWLRDKLDTQLRSCAVISAGAEAYTRRDGIHVIPLALLGA